MPAILRPTLIAIAIGCMAAACSTTPTSQPAATPKAAPALPNTSTAKAGIVNLAAASGSLVSGQLRLVPMGDGVQISGEIGGLAPGSAHGFHVHEKGDCSAADASSAGGHFNPTGNAHGRASMPMHHAGDMDNIVANADGVAKIDIHLSGVSLGGGSANDIVGRAIIVHGDPDDYRSQPSGNAGPRVACGVIEAAAM